MHILWSFEMFLRIQIISSKVKKLVAKGLIESFVQRCSVKKVLLEISQNSQENIKKSLWHRCFFAKCLRTPFLQNTSGGCFWIKGQCPEMLKFCVTNDLLY